MSGKTNIPWATHTWSPVIGCSHSGSQGCDNCWAVKMAYRFAHHSNPKTYKRFGGLAINDLAGVLDKPGIHWTGQVRLFPEELSKPLHWKKPRVIFVCPMADIFHEKVPNEFIAAIYGVMAGCPQHRFIILTKRAKRRREWFEWANDLGSMGKRCVNCLICYDPYVKGEFCLDFPLNNLIEGVSVEDQATADERIPDLLATPAVKRFVSFEPAISLIDFDLPRCELHDREFANGEFCTECQADGYIGEMSFDHWLDPLNGGISWLVMGSESGPNARPMDLDWARQVRDQCIAAGVPYFLKQANIGGKLVKMPELDGKVWSQTP